MKIFIKDIPVNIVSDQELLETHQFDLIIDGSNDQFGFKDLKKDVLIKNCSKKLLDQFLLFLKQNKIKTLEEITFLVDDYKQIVKSIKKQYTVIKAAGGLVLHEGEVLMIYRLKKWDLPKGKLEKGEKPKKAARREVEEECNIKVKLGEKICDTWHTYKQNGKRILKKTYWYKMYCIDDSEMKPQTSENIEDIRWMEEKELRNAFYNTYSSIRHVFRHYYAMD